MWQFEKRTLKQSELSHFNILIPGKAKQGYDSSLLFLMAVCSFMTKKKLLHVTRKFTQAKVYFATELGDEKSFHLDQLFHNT